MRWFYFLALVLGAQPVLADQPAEAVLIVHAGQLLAVPGDAPRAEQTLLVRGALVERVVDGYATAPDLGVSDAELLDLKDQFVMPGLMDLHVHLRGDITVPRARRTQDSAPYEVLRAARNARITLESGFTVVRDLGAPAEVIFGLRDAIADGLAVGPRIFAAGTPVAITGGHGDVSGVSSRLMDLMTNPTICDGADDCRRATRHAIKHGADWVKITATGGVLSDRATGLEQQMTDAELEAVMTAAHAMGRRVAAHAHGTAGINAALRAGVDTIDHGTFLDNESVRLFKQTGAYLVPTMMPGAYLPGMMAGNPNFTPAIQAKTREATGRSKAGVAMAYEAGVKIAFGTDTGTTLHGDNAKEFALMVEAGMSEMDALRSATVTAAEVLEIGERYGTLEAGKRADLIGLSASPLQDITVMESVTTVVQGGEVIQR